MNLLWKIEEEIVHAGLLLAYFITLPLVLLYLMARHRIEKKLRKSGQWPY